MSKPETVYIAKWEHRHGMSIGAYTTEAAAWDWQDGIAAEWAEKEFPDDPPATGADYFARIMNRPGRDDPEFFTVDPVPLLGPQPLGSFIAEHVRADVSALVDTLAGSDYPHGADPLGSLMDAASEAAAPGPDYQAAAEEAGWEDVTTDDYPPNTQFHDTTDGMRWPCSGWQKLCEDHEIEPHETSIASHHTVTVWLADKLDAEGERVTRNFAGLIVWSRTSPKPLAEDPALLRIWEAAG